MAELQNRSNCLFYLLDENEIIFPETEIANILKFYPEFQGIKQEIKKIYKENFNKMSSKRFENIIIRKISNNRKNLILTPTKKQEEKAKEIFLIIQNKIKTDLTDLLPKEPKFDGKVNSFFF